MAQDQTNEFPVRDPRLAPRAAVVGAGSWGTVFAAVLAHAGSRVTILARDPDVAEQIATERRNDRYLSGAVLPPGVDATTEAAGALADADLVAVALPCQSARGVLDGLRGDLRRHAVVVSLMKGIETSTGARMSTVLSEALEISPRRVAVLSGPNLSGEIAGRQPTATVVASADRRTARFVARACRTDYFRPYTNDDVVGVELCGAAKNVVALAVGLAQGHGYGQNTTATLVWRGLDEITRLGAALGADPATFPGLAGLGDLVATCTSPRSRNHTLGRLVGEGVPLEEAAARTATTAEGVATCRSLLATAQELGVGMPVTAGVVDVLYGNGAVEQLLHEDPYATYGRRRPVTLPVPGPPPAVDATRAILLCSDPDTIQNA